MTNLLDMLESESEFLRYMINLGNPGANDQRRYGDSEQVKYVIDRGLDKYSEDFMNFPIDLSTSDNPKEKPLLDIVIEGFNGCLERGEKFRILDLGCGRAEFLLDLYHELEKRYGIEAVKNNLVLVGLSIADLRDNYFSEQKRHSTRDLLATRGIKYLVGDMRHLDQILHEETLNGFDLIFSDMALCYIDPDYMRYNVLKQAYRNLKEGGLIAAHGALILGHGETKYNPFQGKISRDKEFIARHLEQEALKKGSRLQIDIKANNLFLRKESVELSLPMMYSLGGSQLGVVEWAAELRGEILPEINKELSRLLWKVYYTVMHDFLPDNCIAVDYADHSTRTKISEPLINMLFEELNTNINSERQEKHMPAVDTETILRAIRKYTTS
ncbi:class I SAM-dependent methyltransferase [Candidatus Woesearchaeota archaeon]|nr:class I SAM-dependent methyltransferase [Candidatus Woesearchaeota archaeon]